MAKKEFILQGFSSRSHIDLVRELFDVPSINQVLLSIAYIKETGVEQIEDHLHATADNVTVFAGVRNDITSYQALRRLLEVPGLTLYTFDTGTRYITFHPKIYFARGISSARLVLGSANLTLGGLQNNIEAGMLFDFDLSDADDEAVVDQLTTQIEAMPVTYPNNVQRVHTVDDLEALFDNGLIIDELDIPPPRPTTSVIGTGSKASGGSAAGRVPKITLALPTLKSSRTGARLRPLRYAARTLLPASSSTANPSSPSAPATASPVTMGAGAALPTPIPAGHEVWASTPLTERDLNIPTGPKTNLTGSINLDKGLLDVSVDHRHYFRDTVFSGLTWTPNPSGSIEVAYAKFELILRGVSYGAFDLELSHTTSTTSKSYLQKNAMTRLRWGPAKSYIRDRLLLEHTLTLYRDFSDPRRFVIEID